MAKTFDPAIPKSLNLSWLGREAAAHVTKNKAADVPDHLVRRFVRRARENRDKILDLVNTNDLDDDGLIEHAAASLHQTITNPGDPCCHQCPFHPCV